VRYKPGVDGPSGVEILMITSRGGSKGFVFPKGGWEIDETLETAARRETVEEAGVRGALELPLIGTFTFNSGKAERLATANKGRCMAYMFAMAVSEVLEQWPEGTQRSRHWCTIGEAYSRCRYDWMRDAMAVWLQRKGWPVPVGIVGSPAVNGASMAATPVTPPEAATALAATDVRGIAVKT
jgi:diphosphoinositol-polyphosphate diphosphatase